MTKKELSPYKIRDMALNSGVGVFNAQELSNLINKKKKCCTSLHEQTD